MATRACAALTLLLLVACAADAQTVTASGKPLDQVAGPQCALEQRAAVEAARVEAQRRLALAIRFVQERPQDPHVTRWFGTGHNATVLKTFRLTAERMARPNSITFQCNDPPTCARGQMAYARRPGDILGLCPPFFRARMEGQDNRWGILIHEMSHIAANTGDHAYQPRGAAELAKRDAALAVRNADNYEYFVETMPVN